MRLPGLVCNGTQLNWWSRDKFPIPLAWVRRSNPKDSSLQRMHACADGPFL